MLRKVLIVDDNEINRLILRKVLGDEYEVLEAVNGQNALNILRAQADSFSAVLLDIIMPVMDGYEVLRQMRAESDLAAIPVIVTTGNTEEDSEVKALSLGANDYVIKPYKPAVIRQRLRNTINLRETAAAVNALKRDDLTGLYTRRAFLDLAAELIAAHEPGYYVLSCFDIDNFKVVNDQHGNKVGDRVLRHVANAFRDGFTPGGGLCCRVASDHFAVLYPRVMMDNGQADRIRQAAATLKGSVGSITISAGRYVVDDKTLPVSAMYDRATLAQATVKGRYDKRVAQYTEAMRQRLLREQEIVNAMKGALENHEYEVWFQPQYNHATGALIGAEALVRWRWPGRGLVSPGEFIPVFERNGFIYELDQYVWETACQCLRKWLDEGRRPLPVSVNISRYDLFSPDLVATINRLIKRYRLPVDLLRLEITESAFAQSADQLIAVAGQLIADGFTVEIDDFGSGYSSLNALKDVPANIIKLDMRFLEGSRNTARGGSILESIVRMAKWLGMPVIAEGVESLEQADYLRSIGCLYIQGYLYAKPMPVEEYEALAQSAQREEKLLSMETIQSLDNEAFWNPSSIETLIFNSYVGCACVLEYCCGSIDMLRANAKYVDMLAAEDIPMETLLKIDWKQHMDDESRRDFSEAAERSAITGDEQSREYTFVDLPGARPKLCLRMTLRVIATAGERRLIYCMSENVTDEKEALEKLKKTDEQLRFLNETARLLLADIDSESGVKEVLRKTLSYFGAERAFISEYDAERNRCATAYEVCAEGVASYSAAYGSFPLDSPLCWFEAFQTANFFRLPDVLALGDDRAEERAAYEALNIHSVRAVALRAGGRVVGAMGVFNPTLHREMNDENLAAVGSYVAVILNRLNHSQATLSGGAAPPKHEPPTR